MPKMVAGANCEEVLVRATLPRLRRPLPLSRAGSVLHTTLKDHWSSAVFAGQLRAEQLQFWLQLGVKHPGIEYGSGSPACSADRADKYRAVVCIACELQRLQQRGFKTVVELEKGDGGFQDFRRIPARIQILELAGNRASCVSFIRPLAANRRASGHASPRIRCRHRTTVAAETSPARSWQ